MISIIGSPAQFSQQLLGGFLGNQETMVATPLVCVCVCACVCACVCVCVGGKVGLLSCNINLLLNIIIGLSELFDQPKSSVLCPWKHSTVPVIYGGQNIGIPKHSYI